MSEDIVQRARALVGVKFRPQGRRPDLGLDCIGVVLQVYRIVYAEVPSYRLRGRHVESLRAALLPYFDEVPSRHLRPGDALLMQVADEQVHMAVYCGPSIVHADARIGRIVETPGRPPWPIVSIHRHRPRHEI